MNEVNEYYDNLNKDQVAELKRIEKLVNQLVPNAELSLSYGVPTYKYMNTPLIYFAAFKNHYSIFPTTGPINKLQDKLTKYKTSKGTIQFTNSNPLPDGLLMQIINYRKKEIDNKVIDNGN